MPKPILRSHHAARLTLLALLALAVGWSHPAVAKHSKRKSAAAAGTADCKVDHDCVLVVDDCCPCNKGGKQRAIPKKDKTSYEKDRKKRCAGTACTEMMSTDPSCSETPFCGAGICELGAPSSSSPP
ncbi:MAG TPA: hypothetical protein VH374_17715 [Polyangia bacterium]|jgi:hypothetical protein|nr:hypothetical protein [Polyangia bacterium]